MSRKRGRGSEIQRAQCPRILYVPVGRDYRYDANRPSVDRGRQMRRSYTIQPASRASYGVLAQSKEHSEGGGAFLTVDCGWPPDVEGPPAYAEAAVNDSRSRARVSNIVSVMFSVSREIVSAVAHVWIDCVKCSGSVHQNTCVQY